MEKKPSKDGKNKKKKKNNIDGKRQHNTNGTWETKGPKGTLNKIKKDGATTKHIRLRHQWGNDKKWRTTAH